jgi:hypothetical protein
MSRVKNQVSSGAPEIEYNESISRSTRQRVENDRRAASAGAAAPGSVETLHLSQVFTGGPQSNGHAMVFGVAPIPLWEDSAVLMAGVERDTRSASRSINHRLLPTTVSAVS